MSHNLGDSIWPHHPDTTVDGDLPVNNRPGDTWYLLVDAGEDQAIAWAIINECIQAISWHIFPELIPYIAQFVINEIRSAYEIECLTANFDVCPVDFTNVVETVLEDSVSLSPLDIDTAFVFLQKQFSFTLKENITSNFKITGVFDNTRTP